MFKLEFRTDNAAFDADATAEVSRILRQIADAVERGTSGAPLYDTNGNRIGRFDWKGVDE